MIGGGDTGADCVGNSIREGALSVTQLELLPEPPANRPDDRTPWPLWPAKFRLSYAMEEAKGVGKGEQDFSVVTTRFIGEDGRVTGQHIAQADAAPPFAPVAGTERELHADLVLLAMGFVHPEQEGIVAQLGCELDARGNVKAGDLRDLGPRRLRRRRRAPRPVADRLGDQRGPPGRAHGRAAPGLELPSARRALSASRGA